MASCERCWWEAQRRGVEYSQQVLDAQRNNEPCTRGDEEGARLRAGDYWDAERKIDTRTLPVSPDRSPSDA